jgi:hypothetical protein
LAKRAKEEADEADPTRKRNFFSDKAGSAADERHKSEANAMLER